MASGGQGVQEIDVSLRTGVSPRAGAEHRQLGNAIAAAHLRETFEVDAAQTAVGGHAASHGLICRAGELNWACRRWSGW
jgi:hypothetical protein